MADDMGLPIPSPTGTIQQGENPATAGMPYAATADALDKVAASFGGMSQMLEAHQAVIHQANVARTQQQISDQAQNLQQQYQYDPNGFAAAAAQGRSAFIKTQPGEYAIGAANAWDATMGQARQQVAERTFAVDHANAGVSLQDGVKASNDTIRSNIASGASLNQAMSLPVVQQAIALRSAHYDALVVGHFIDNDTRAFQEQEDRTQDMAAAYQGYLTRGVKANGLAWGRNELQRFQNVGTQADAPPAGTASGSPTPATGSASPAPAGSVASDTPSLAGPPAAPTGAASSSQASSSPGASSAPVMQAGGVFEDGVPLTRADRVLIASKGAETVEQLQAQASQVIAAAASQRAQAQLALNSQKAAELQYITKHGEPSGNGPGDDTIQNVEGPSNFKALSDWTDAKKAAIQQNQNDRLTPGMSSDQVAQRAVDNENLKPLDVELNTPEKIAGLRLAIYGQEGGVDSQGNGLPNRQGSGALGRGQLLPGTAVAIAHAHGITALDGLSAAQQQAALLAQGQQLNTQLSDLGLNDLTVRYGNAAAVATSWHGGFHYGADGRVVSPPAERVLASLSQSGEDLSSPQAWHASLMNMGMPRTADYVTAVANRMKLGQEQAGAAATIQRDSLVTKEAVSDPLPFGVNHSLIGPLATLNPQGFASPDPRQQAAFATALQQRQRQGQVLAQQNSTLPARILTSAEAASYRSMVDRDGGVAVKLADAATGALGTQGATEFMREVGLTDGKGTVGMQAAMVAASGPNGRRFANDIVDGLNAKNQPDAKPEALAPGSTWGKTQAAIAPAFAQMDSSQLAAIMGTAHVAALGQSQHGTPATPEANVRGALGGATNYQTGETFGGIDPNVNGKPVILSPWLKVGTMPSALQKIAVTGRLGPQAPVYSNGQPMRPADVAGLQPELTSDGTYVLRDGRTNQIARVKGGAAYRLDMEAQKGFLAHLGGYVQAGQ